MFEGAFFLLCLTRKTRQKRTIVAKQLQKIK